MILIAKIKKHAHLSEINKVTTICCGWGPRTIFRGDMEMPHWLLVNNYESLFV